MHQFTVYGEDYDKVFNPVGYFRTTQRAKYANKGYKKYARWKAAVQSAFIQSLTECGEPNKFGELDPQYGKIVGDGPWFVETRHYFHNRSHADNDNIHKGVLDSLLCNDKYVCGSYWPFYHMGEPRAEIMIIKLSWKDGNFDLDGIRGNFETTIDQEN